LGSTTAESTAEHAVETAVNISEESTGHAIRGVLVLSTTHIGLLQTPKGKKKTTTITWVEETDAIQMVIGT
jgi:hypothetical protein